MAAPLREEVDGEEKADEEEEGGVAHGVEQAVAEERLVVRLQDIAQVAERRDGGRGRGARRSARRRCRSRRRRRRRRRRRVASEANRRCFCATATPRGRWRGLPERFAPTRDRQHRNPEASKYPSSFATSGASRSANAPRLAPDERRGDEFFANDIGASGDPGRGRPPGARARFKVL